MKSKEELSKKIHGVIIMNQNLVKFSTAENIGISEFHLISFNIGISFNFLEWKVCGKTVSAELRTNCPKLCENCAFLQNLTPEFNTFYAALYFLQYYIFTQSPWTIRGTAKDV